MIIKYRTVDDTYDGDYQPVEDFGPMTELRPGDYPDIPTGGAIDLFVGDLVIRCDISEWGTIRCEKLTDIGKMTE